MSRAVVDAKEFSHAMSKISKILKKCAIPILEEVCLRIQNGRCTLTATDLETWLTAELPASGDDMFFVFRKTKDILRACSHFAGELTMEFSETQSGSKKAGRVLLRCERRGAEFEVYDGADYPNMPQAPEGDAFSVSSARLSACVERVRYAAEKPSVSARPAAICVQFCGNRVYALDGTRLACDTLEGVSFPKPFLVRADVLAHLSAFGKEDMTVRIGSSHVLFASGNLRMLARLQGVDTYSNPDISDLTAAIPYTVFPSGLLCHHGRNISFCHDNYRDFFAAFHIANVVYGLYSGIDLAALSPDAQEVFLLQLETLDNSILFDAISILRQYFGLSIYDISAQDTTDLSDTCAQIALPAILIRLLDAVIRRGELSKNEHSQLCQLRSTLCERFVLSFKALDESDPLQTKYCLFFSLALSMLARDYRTGVAGTRDLIKCAGYAQQCINGEKKLNIPKADGYLQVALCLNARMEDMLNVTDTKMNGTLPFSSQLADAVREAVRDYHEGSMYKRDEAVRTFRRNLFPRWKPGLGNVLACCDIFQIILEAAYEKYVSAANQNNQNYQEIARLGYVSKAYLVLAAIGTSGGALNLLAQMLINQANQYEADQRISFFRRHPDIDTFVQQHAAPYGWPLNDNYALAYRVLQSVCGIQRGSQPYSHMKKAELVLKGYVSESSSTQLTSLNIAINGGLAMGHYWKGRLLLEQAKQDHDRCNDYKDAAIASFCATNVTERFDHLPENADEDAAPQLSPPQWLSAIELLRYPDRAVFRVDRRMVFQTIYQKLTQQVEEVQSDNIQIHNERYRLTKKDVRSNLERCLDMVKAQFPDKEPLIQKMIRSIR